MTLIELMIVVAVIGILASIASVSYVKYIKSAKIGKLEQYAMEVASAQEQYKAQNSGYLDIEDPYASGEALWEDLLGFQKQGLAGQNITVATEAGDSTSTACSICEGADPSFTGIWFAVAVTQDLDDDTNTDPTTVVYHNELEQPILLNENQ
jgi:prepilin-type N-terminal cleavage/methylation domain-containing protein